VNRIRIKENSAAGWISRRIQGYQERLLLSRIVERRKDALTPAP